MYEGEILENQLCYEIGNYYYYERVTPAGSTQRYYIARGSGEEERQEIMEK